MRKILSIIAVISLVLWGCSQRSQTGRSATAEAPAKRIDILFLGHESKHHDSERFFPMLAMPLFQEGISLHYTADPADLTAENLKNYDGLMLYANHTKITPEQEQAVKAFVEGGKALIPIHSASFMFQNSDWYINAVGGQFKSHKVGTFTADITKPEHPVMQGLSEFETWDETYVHHKLNPDMTVLMERVEGDHHEPWTWVRDQGKGKVFYTAYGHDERTWGNPGFHALVASGVKWAVSDEAKERLARLNIPTPTFEEANIPNYEQRDPAPRLQHPLSAEESQKLIKVPVDFELQLFASEPDIVNPIAMAWDERGRLWVIETKDYPNEIRTDDGRGDDRIKILEDTDGNGKADKVTVFAEDLNIPTSMVFANGGVIISMAPHFVFLKDTDGDDKADVRENIMTGWGKSDTHAGPSNLKYGLDNKIWGVVGYSGFQGTVNDREMSFSQAVYRFDPDGGGLEHLGRTTNNTWGLGFSEEFDVFISTANGLHSAYFAMPNQYTKRAVAGGSGNTVYRIDTHYDMPHITPYLRQVDWHGGYTAAAGHNIYTARDYPKSFWNSVGLVAEPTGRVLHKAVLERKGAGYTEKNGFNLLASSDEWFAPVHAEVGPDGAIWVADWYNFIIQHNPTPRGFENGEGNAYVNPWRDRQHGRIYRLVYKGGKPHEPMQLSKDDTAGLLAALSNDNMFWRTTAQRLIVENQTKELIPGLIALAKDQRVDEIGLNSPAVHALWTLHGLGALDGTNAQATEAAMAALSHPAAGVRKNAVQVLPRNEATLEAIQEAKLLNDRDLRVRMAAALAIADMPASPELGKLVYEASLKPENGEDEYLPQALFAAALAHQPGFMAAAPKNLSLERPDSVLNLTERLVKSMGQEQYRLDRWTPILFPPDVTGKEITVRASIGPSDDGFEGVIMSQGDKDAGYSLYVQDNKLHWLVKQKGKPYIATSTTALPTERFDAVARLANGGVMTINVNGKTVAEAKAPSLFTQPLAEEEVRVGRDVREGENRVGDYPDRFYFKGELRRDASLELKKPVEGAKSKGNTTVAAVTRDKNVRAVSPNTKPAAKTAATSTAKAATVSIRVVEHEMKFDKESFTVKAGQKVTLNFSNPDFMQHNFVLIMPGTLEEVGKAADALARDPKGAEKNYVPNTSQVIVATPLVDPQGRETLVFTAPDKPGEYPFVCTVPGHWRLMNGIMKVE
ncbi:PVC-type heme-binding CxxCH protein [Pontibacter russatus]|uniref:PVC-type heme-binding CxxCH protein n=1 Tax=Pontibacter russatus TaxID=2694929 RepID=UPI001379CE36|nr:PVC-type heme-binding CxxCH protein [Pontibacter russatus]